VPNQPLNIRSYTWGASGLSWAYVIHRLVDAFDRLGHNTFVASTNGMEADAFYDKDKMVKSIMALQDFGTGKKSIDLDFTYTVMPNLPQRFLSNSKAKCVIYNYETNYWPKEWRKYYHIPDFYFPSSNFSAEIFHINGIPAEKIFVIPHGVDTSVFNPDIPPIKLKTKKRFKFLSVVAPHYRKNIGATLEAYCKAFKKTDDVCMVLKTKVYKHSDGEWDQNNPEKNPNGRKGFEIVLGDVFKELYKKFGKDNIPEIELLGGHVENVASIYNACDCHISTTSCEGFFMPGIESFASNLINIATNYSAHLDYMNEDNALLIDTKLRKAKLGEQYWGFNKNSMAGEVSVRHTAELMRHAYENHDELLEKFRPEMEKTVRQFSWESAAQMMIDATTGDLPHYEPNSYHMKAHRRIK